MSLHHCLLYKGIPDSVIASSEEDGELFKEDPEDATEMNESANKGC